MQISIIIINYNTFQITCDCIESVIKFTQEINYEIILVDNASTECDPTLFLKKFPSIKLIASKENTGFTGGNNLGIKVSKGDYILLLNSDTWLSENSIKKSFDKAKTISNLGALTCGLKWPNGELQPNCFNHFNWWKFLLEKFRIIKILPKKLLEKIYLGFHYRYKKSCFCDGIIGAFYLFPASNLKLFKNNILPNNFFMYYEEMDWSMSLKKNKKKCFSYIDTFIYHIGGASSNDNSKYNTKERLLQLSKIHNKKLDYYIFKLFMN